MTDPTAPVDPTARIAELEATVVSLNQALNKEYAEKRAAQKEVDGLRVKLAVQEDISKKLRSGLEFYKPGDFWETVVQDTKADADRGKHAEWILRMTGDGPESA